jgi:hypothetical protein
MLCTFIVLTEHLYYNYMLILIAWEYEYYERVVWVKSLIYI